MAPNYCTPQQIAPPNSISYASKMPFEVLSMERKKRLTSAGSSRRNDEDWPVIGEQRIEFDDEPFFNLREVAPKLCNKHPNSSQRRNRGNRSSRRLFLSSTRIIYPWRSRSWVFSPTTWVCQIPRRFVHVLLGRLNVSSST